jgi:hypothetical protein
MNDKSIRFSLLRGRDESVLTKKYHLDEGGGICKINAPNFANGTAETICIEELRGIENVIEGLGTNECIATGIFDSSPCEIVTTGMLDEERLNAGTRSRAKEHMRQPNHGIVLFDHDISPYMPKHLRCDSPDKLMSTLRQAIPQLAMVGYSGTNSCSSGITITATGEPYQGGGGLHAYIVVKGVDLESFQRSLAIKLWNAGFGYIAFARNGAMLERCIVDLTVLSPERLIYEAEPILGEGLSRCPREWQHRDGTALTGDFNVTADDSAEYKRRVATAKADLSNRSKAEELADRYHEARVDTLAKHKSISREEARQLIHQQSAAERDGTEYTLHPNDVIEIQGKQISVSELLERGSEFDNLAMPDPVEGSSYGMTTAKFYFNNGLSPCINSFAHGVMRIYRLGNSDSFTPCDYQVIDADETLGGTIDAPSHLLENYSLRGMCAELSKEYSEQIPILGGIILRHQSSVIYAAPNTGKTLVILRLLVDGIKQGKIDPSHVFYINEDDTLNGIIEKLELVEENGFHMLTGGYNDFKADALLGMLNDIGNDQAKRTILILDTLKRFTDLMDKRLGSRFGKAIRKFVMKGGTCISLAHTNKHRTSDGKPIYAGTTDIIDDADCAYLMYEVGIDVDAETKTILFENVKSRGNVARQASYRYSITEGLSYREMFDTVAPIDDTELVTLKQSGELRSDTEVIDAITQCIREGIDSKMRLAVAAAKRSGISKRAVLRLIDKYTGSDPNRHRWNFQVRERGTKTYRLLIPDTTGSDPVS